MESSKSTAATGKNGEKRTTPERSPEDAQWDALDRPEWSAVERTAGGVWPLAVRVRPVRQMAGRRYAGDRVPCAERGCGQREFQYRFHLYQGT